MTTEEKLTILEDVLEMESGTLKPDTKLSEMQAWDSMAHISLIAVCDDEYGKKLTGEQIRSFNTVQDVLDFME